MGIECAGDVHEFADSQLGHVFATGATRDAARRTLVAALRTLMVRGQVRCTTETLISLLESPGTQLPPSSVPNDLCDALAAWWVISLLAVPNRPTKGGTRGHFFECIQSSAPTRTTRRGWTR
jgi:hypothetical protein